MFGYYDSAIDERYQRERFIIDKLDNAIKQRHITPYYQAVVRVMTEEVSGYEADKSIYLRLRRNFTRHPARLVFVLQLRSAHTWNA